MNTIVERLYEKTTPKYEVIKGGFYVSGIKISTDHQRVKQWVVERGGCPARKDTDTGKTSGVLRVDTPATLAMETLETNLNGKNFGGLRQE